MEVIEPRRDECEVNAKFNLMAGRSATRLRASRATGTVALFHGIALDARAAIALLRARPDDAVREKLTALGKTFEIVVYDGAGHGFFCDERASFAPKAAADAWTRTLSFFRQHLG